MQRYRKDGKGKKQCRSNRTIARLEQLAPLIVKVFSGALDPDAVKPTADCPGGRDGYVRSIVIGLCELVNRIELVADRVFLYTADDYQH